jgi:hypothetical protein
VNPRTTGILFLVAAALAAFVYFYEIRGEEGRRAAEGAEKRIFGGFEGDDVEAIALITSDGKSVRAERRGDGWELVSPLVFPADEFALDAMAAALAQITGENAIENPQPASVYGLDADEREVRFWVRGEEHALRIGDKTPMGANSYVSVVGETGVYSVPTYRVRTFAKTLDDLREKRVLDFDREAVAHIEASWPGGRVVLERGDAGWKLVQPVTAPADDDVVDGLLSDLSFLRASGFVDDPPPDEETGLDRPAFAVRLSGPASGEGGEAWNVGLAIGSRSEDGTRLARASRTTLYRISEDRLADFPTDVSAYRFKQLAAFEASDAKRLEILFHSAAGESVAITAERAEFGWTSWPESFQPGKVAALIGTLATLRARDIAADSMGPKELEAIGLSPAKAIFRVVGEAPADAEQGEAPTLAEVHLGIHRGADGIYAQRAGDDTVYVLAPDLAEYLPVSYEAFVNRFRSKPATEEPKAAAEQ